MCSRLTGVKSAACKASIENHYTELFCWLNARNERKKTLEQIMERKSYSEPQKEEKRRDLSLLESKYLRERRIKLDKNWFETLRVIGRGGFGEVRLVKLKNTERIFAMKVMKKAKLIQRKQENHVNSERNALAYVSELYTQNPWVIKLFYSFQDEESLYLVMEYLAGGDMMHKLIEKDVFTLDQTRFYIAELVLAIESIHELGFIHRDVKPDNILLDPSDKGHIKLTDFGLCTGYMARKSWNFSNNENINFFHDHNNNSNNNNNIIGDQCDNMDTDQSQTPSTPPSEAPFHNSNVRFNSWKKKRKFMAYSAVGTADYIAPEVLTENGYSKECDWWSVGVIMFEMLAGGPPFSSHSPFQTRKNVINYKHVLSSGWQLKELMKFHPIARDLIFRFLSPSDVRIGSNGVKEIKDHPFFEGIDWNNIRSTTPPFLPTITGPTDSRNFPSDEIMAEEQTPYHPSPSFSLAEQEENDRLAKMERFIGFTFKGSFHFSDSFIPLSL